MRLILILLAGLYAAHALGSTGWKHYLDVFFAVVSALNSVYFSIRDALEDDREGQEK